MSLIVAGLRVRLSLTVRSESILQTGRLLIYETVSSAQDPLGAGGESFFSSLDDHWLIVLDNNSRKRFTADVSLNSSGTSRELYVVDAAETGSEAPIPVNGWSI